MLAIPTERRYWTRVQGALSVVELGAGKMEKNSADFNSGRVHEGSVHDFKSSIMGDAERTEEDLRESLSFSI